MLGTEEIERYARHIVLPEIGGAGQQKLKAARILVIGAGGLGAPVLQYLAAAGVGTLGIADDDIVSLSNLQRQIIHDTENVGIKKTESAKHALSRINPNVSVEIHDVRVTEDNADDLIAGYDIVADGSDNFRTRYAVADSCERMEKVLVSAAVGRFDGTLTTLKPFARNSEGGFNPSYRCLYPTEPEEGSVPTCAQAGVLGVLTGVMGTLQALEIVKEITGAGEGMVGRLLLFDSLSMRFETIRYKRDPKRDI
ncbi:MAG: molybdopterin-synthase adenylyltransferase MoeB [Pseudomonadota bacterium]